VSLLSTPEPMMAVLERAHSLLEGPRIGPEGEIVYSDVIAGGLWACMPDGSIVELLPKRRGIGGVLAHSGGGWVVSGKSIVHVLPDGSQRELLSDPGVPGYNDIASSPTGDLLVGELRYRPMAGNEPREGRLLLIGAGGEARVLSEQVLWPNGIGLAPDGRTIYISDYARQCVFVASLDGGNTELFARSPQGSADGLAVDQEGGVWVALGEGGGVARFDPDGELDEIVEVPASFVSSISFGGHDRRDVLISTADNLIRPELGGMLLRARSEVAGLTMTPVSI
jgi:sugar lactone lactonase YvrE